MDNGQLRRKPPISTLYPPLMSLTDIIQQSIKPHDRYQIEMKLDYELLDDKETHYQVSTYIFAPRSLGLSPESYQKNDFYRGVQNYIRLKTPVFNLQALSNDPQSPLLNIENIIHMGGWERDESIQEQLVTNFKLLSSMLKSSIREHINFIHKRVEDAPKGTKTHQIINSLVEEFLVGTATFATKFRDFYGAFNMPGINEGVLMAFMLTDESVSLLIEESAVEMHEVVMKYLKGANCQAFIERLETAVKAETKYRRTHGYTSILRENAADDNEIYLFRASALKKFASSVLHLSTAVSPEGRGLEQILYAIAAGIAMIIATLIAYVSQQRYGNSTLPFFVAIVVGYMFKDRIKEFVREVLAARFLEDLYDRRIEIRTLDGKHKLGILREKMTFLQEEDVPKPVLHARNKDHFVDLQNDGQSETIIRYKKDIILYADAFKDLSQDMPDITGLNDIIRFDVRRYLKKMAEPQQERLLLKDGQVKTIKCHKIYYLNLVSRYRSISPAKEKTHSRLRLVLDQEGIKRIEHISI